MPPKISPICRNNILLLARAYAKRRTPSLRMTTVSGMAHSDPNFLDNLSQKKVSVTTRKYDEVIAWFYSNWPDGMKMPEIRNPFP